MGSRLAELIAGWKPFHGLVVGDVLADVYPHQNFDSRKLTPAQLMRDDVLGELDANATTTPGGAANAAVALAQLTTDEARVHLVGIGGNDIFSHRLETQLKEKGVQSWLFYRDEPTPLKIRPFGIRSEGGRIDHEFRYRPNSSRTEILDTVHSLGEVNRPGVVLVSDYDKGLIGPWLYANMPLRSPLVINTKRPDRHRDTGPRTFVTMVVDYATACNFFPGLGAAAGTDMWDAIQRAVDDRNTYWSVLVTAGCFRATLFQAFTEPVAIRIREREDGDPLGAGDATSAALAAALANAMNLEDAARVACAAGTASLDGRGCNPPSRDRLIRELNLRAEMGIDP
jgi:bifunctional ADP-heptose synthase (sugar kinase/adenylyltransferase)